MPIVPPTNPISKFNSKSNEFVSREDVILRRLHHMRKLLRIYRNQYWGLMEEARARYSKYVWETGKSPFESDEEENNSGERVKCKWNGCAKKAMPLTDYCFSHILEDKKQTLYAGCRFITKRSPLLRCNKPVLRSKVPCYCAVHYQRTQKLQDLKNFGPISSGKTAPKFRFLVSEYVRQIQTRRRKAKLSIAKSIVEMEINSANKLLLVPHQKTESGCMNMLPPTVPSKSIISVGKNRLPPFVPTEKIISVGMNMLPPLVPRGTLSYKQSPLLQKSKGVMMHPTPNRMQHGQLSGRV